MGRDGRKKSCHFTEEESNGPSLAVAAWGRAVKPAPPKGYPVSVNEICDAVKQKTNGQKQIYVCGLAGCDSRLSAVVEISQAVTFELGQRSLINIPNKLYRSIVQTLTACLCKQATRLISEQIPVGRPRYDVLRVSDTEERSKVNTRPEGGVSGLKLHR